MSVGVADTADLCSPVQHKQGWFFFQIEVAVFVCGRVAAGMTR